MIRRVFVCSLIVLALFLESWWLKDTRVNSVEVPNVESWKEIVYSDDSNNDKKDRGQIFIRWFQDPRGNGYDGMVLYHKLSNIADATPIIKAWGFRRTKKDGDYDWGETRVAMWLEDKGVWFMGDQGERLKTSRQYKDGKTTSVTYTFKGRNSSISKTVRLEEESSTLEQRPYPTSP